MRGGGGERRPRGCGAEIAAGVGWGKEKVVGGGGGGGGGGEQRSPPKGEKRSSTGWGGRHRRRGGGEEIVDTAMATSESNCDSPRLAHHLFSSLIYFRFLRFPQICKFGVWNWFPRV